MSNGLRDLDKNDKLSKIFSYLVVYYWILMYIKMPSYVLLTLPIGLFIGYMLLIYIKDFTLSNGIPMILLFIIFAVYLSLIRLDMTSLIAVALFGLTIFMIMHFRLRLSLKLINTLFFISVLLSIPLYYSGYGYYGFLPGQGGYHHNAALSGRVSMFPNVTISIYFSFIVVFINYSFAKHSYEKIFIFIFSLYFIYFGISRTIMIVLLLILIFSLLLKVYPLKKNWFYQFFLPIVLIFLPIVFVAVIEDIIEYLLSLNNEFISEYFFRGFTSVEKILDDIARTNIWTEHIRLFKEHPWGLSTSEIDLYSIIYLSDGGSESFLTRILVRFGFSAFFFYLFIFSLLKSALDDRDNYLYIFTYIFIFIGVNYGSFFAAYNMLFLILMSSINNKYAIEKE